MSEVINLHRARLQLTCSTPHSALSIGRCDLKKRQHWRLQIPSNTTQPQTNGLFVQVKRVILVANSSGLFVRNKFLNCLELRVPSWKTSVLVSFLLMKFCWIVRCLRLKAQGNLSNCPHASSLGNPLQAFPRGRSTFLRGSTRVRSDQDGHSEGADEHRAPLLLNIRRVFSRRTKHHGNFDFV